ncbi:MAG: galactose-1-phosphate uridylyltransferase [Candidatus Brocadiia bacterium]
MPELRKDPVIGRWIIIAPERFKRPSDFITGDRFPATPEFCPFCEGNESQTPPEILSYRDHGEPNAPGWRVRVVPNKYPCLRIEGNLGKKGDGIYDIMNGIGAHEVILETPRHLDDITELEEKNIVEIFWAYRDRLVDLKRDRRFVYGSIFKNVGLPAGAQIQHSHSQLIVTPVVPKNVAEEMNGCMNFYNYRGRCLFCDMIAQEQEDRRRIVMETENFVVITPFASRFPFEMWLLPIKHSSVFENLPNYAIAELAGVLKNVMHRLNVALDKPPYNFVVHTGPFDRGEMTYYHWHIEIIPRLIRVAGFEWSTDFYINPVPPEEAARFLREVEA